MNEQIELTPELLAALKAQASEWKRGGLTIASMPFDPRVVLALVAEVEALRAEITRLVRVNDEKIRRYVEAQMKGEGE